MITEKILNDLYDNIEGYKDEAVKSFWFDPILEVYSFEGGIVWDIENGVIIELGENKEIKRAIRGYDTLYTDELHELYGKPPIFSKLKWPLTNREMI
jgi:hypothetical protein